MRRLIYTLVALLPLVAVAAIPAPLLTLSNGTPLEAYHQVGDADDTASLTRAVAAGGPILLGPRTYTINNFTSAIVSSFILRGVPGKSIIQRTSASGSQFFDIRATNVVIDGVTFDMNKASVTADQWGVFMASGGQNVTVTRSVFENNSGSLGACFVLQSTGPGAGGSFTFADNEVTGCTALAGARFASVSNGVIRDNYVHDNTTVGIAAQSNGAASNTNYLADVLIKDNRTIRNTTGIFVGGISPPYVYGTPAAVRVQVLNNILQDNSGYELGLQGDYLTATGNQISQSASSVTVFGGIDCNARWNVISKNTITLTSSAYGIDCGGAVGMSVTDNLITMHTSGSAIDSGGNSGGSYTGNQIILDGTAVGFLNYQVEADGNGVPFPVVASGTQLDGNYFTITGSGPTGIELLDNPGGSTGAAPISVRNNYFSVSGGGSSTQQDIVWYGAASSLLIGPNFHNGTNDGFLDPLGNGDISFDLVYFGGTIYGVSATTDIRSILPSVIETYGGGGSILYVKTTAGGSGYTAATTLSASGTGGGSGWTGTPLISQGVIVGVKTTSFGSGYSGTITVTATDTGGGTGATFTVGNNPRLPSYATLRYISVATHLLKKSGGAIALDTNYPFQLDNTTVVGLQALSSGAFWNVLNYTLPKFTVSTLPTCNATSAGTRVIVSDASGPTYNGTLTGGGSSNVNAVCDGSNWTAH